MRMHSELLTRGHMLVSCHNERAHGRGGACLQAVYHRTQRNLGQSLGQTLRSASRLAGPGESNWYT